MSPFWVPFKTGAPGCVEAKDEAEARALVEAGLPGRLPTEVVTIGHLPYPASPRLNPPAKNACPSFCFRPEDCVGRWSCPRDRSCVD